MRSEVYTQKKKKKAKLQHWSRAGKENGWNQLDITNHDSAG